MNEETPVTPTFEQPKSLGPISQMYRDLIDCLTEPRLFFTERYPKINFTYALAFGIIIAWLGAVLEWLTRVVRHETLLDGLLQMRNQLQQLPIWKNLPADIWAQQTPEQTSMFPAWLAEVCSVALSPFSTLLGFLISGLILWVGASILVPKDPAHGERDTVNLSNLIKIAALASVPKLVGSILGFLPLALGTFIGSIYAFCILLLALSIRYKVSYLRSFAIVALPRIIGVMVFGCIIGVFVTLIFGTIAALFQVH